MDQCSDTTVTTLTSSSSSPSPRSQPAVVSPCAACKILRRRCIDKCILAPYFPPQDPLKFTTAHRVFGASNIIKFLQELPDEQRADAVNSMVYEANARLRDPVYGCAGAICQLQRQVGELQQQLAKAQAQLLNVQCQNTNLMALICVEMSHQSNDHHEQQQYCSFIDSAFLDENNITGLVLQPEQHLQPLWT